MATNSNVTKVHKSLMQNTAKTSNGKSAPAKATAAKKPAGKAAAKTTQQSKNKRNYTRNGAVASLFGSALAAFGGAAVITGCDLLINRFAPQISTTVRTVVKVGAGVGFKMFGKKLPFVGAYSDTVGNAFLLAGALDILGNKVVPYVVNWLAPAAVSAPVVVKDPATGQLGYEYQTPDGRMRIFDDANDAYPPNYSGYPSNQGANYYQ